MKHLSTTAILVAALAGCAVPDRGDPIPEVAQRDTFEVADTRPSDGDAVEEISEVDTAEPPVSFADDGVHAYLVANCTSAGCHSAGAGGYSIIDDLEADYEATLMVVTKGDGLGSKLVKKASGASSHTGGPILTEGTADYDLIVEWINDGANP